MASLISLTQTSTQTSPITNTAGNVWKGNYGKLSDPAFHSRALKTIRAVSLIHFFFGTKDYRTAHEQLRTDAAVYMKGISNFRLDIATAANDWNAGIAIDVGLTSDVWSILKEGADFNSMSDQELDRIIAFLMAQAAI